MLKETSETKVFLVCLAAFWSALGIGVLFALSLTLDFHGISPDGTTKFVDVFKSLLIQSAVVAIVFAIAYAVKDAISGLFSR